MSQAHRPYKFIHAKHYRWADRKTVDSIILHCAQSPELPTVAEALGNYAATMPDGRTVSWHYAIDDDSVVQCVLEKHVAFCAPGTNSTGIQIEFSGMHSQTRAEWLDEFGTKMLALGAKVVAEACVRWDIPVRFVDAAGLLRGDRGISTHWEVTKGPGKGRTTHIDPGPNFPMSYFLDLVADEIGIIRGLYDHREP